MFSSTVLVLAIVLALAENVAADAYGKDQEVLRRACPDYTSYATFRHSPYSEGPLKLPFQRPAEACRTFTSSIIDQAIGDITTRMVDKDLAQLFQNAFPNTLDTTIRWHSNGSTTTASPPTTSTGRSRRDTSLWEGPQTFIVTGDINAEWLRDSTNQLAPYQAFAKDPSLHTLILGAISTQAEFVIQSPYCNAFQPPPPSGLGVAVMQDYDDVHPVYDPLAVFECKYELDSLAHFLALGNRFYESSGSKEFLTSRWYKALDTLTAVLDAESQPTFNSHGGFQPNTYTFQRRTTASTETLGLSGNGNPLNSNTGLIRSAFRPSDDATIFGFFIPANAMMSVELRKAADVIETAGGDKSLVENLRQRSRALRDAVWEHGVMNHPKYGSVFAYEVDGYGSRVFMDDANIPSLLSLPLLGFVDQNDDVYQNTRRMILDQGGNPYFLTGSDFHAIGGPHIGLRNAWPMSLLVQALTSDDDSEILECINAVRNSSRLGLVHESINVNDIQDYTRSWFAWANSLFAQTILKIAMEKPQLIFGSAEPYTVPGKS